MLRRELTDVDAIKHPNDGLLTCSCFNDYLIAEKERNRNRRWDVMSIFLHSEA